MPRTALIIAAVLLLAACSGSDVESDPSIDCSSCEAWNEALAPFQVFGNTYYVGTAGLSSILIDSGNGLVLLDGALPQSAKRIAANIDRLGFDARDIRFIAVSHAHFDHVGGIAALQRLSGATVIAGKDAVRMLEKGGSYDDDPQFGPELPEFPAVAGALPADRSSTLRLGDVVLRGVPTPGHSPGGMSWTWQSCEEGRCLAVVYADSLSPVSAPGYRFSDGMAARIRSSATRIAGLDCDIFLSTHDFSFDLHGKLAAGRDAFVDPEGCERYAEATLERLERRLEDEQQ